MAGFTKMQQHTAALGKDEGNLPCLTPVCRAFHSPDTRRASPGWEMRADPSAVYGGGRAIGNVGGWTAVGLAGTEGYPDRLWNAQDVFTLTGLNGRRGEEDDGWTHLEKDFPGYRSANYLLTSVPPSLTKILKSTKEAALTLLLHQ